MSLRDTNNIDIIVKSPHTDGYDLILVDSGDVVDPTERYNLLLDKLSSYIGFVASGDFHKSHPDAKWKRIRFCVISNKLPNDAMLKVEAIKPRDNPSMIIPVVFYSQTDYLNKGR